MSNLIMLLIAAHGPIPASQPEIQRSVWRPTITVQRRIEEETDFVICKDGRVLTFPIGQPKRCDNP
ncbi:hypothetical protein [Burkholderia pyrrocinia]|uniref:hypothetical protein n=1 Tax=Burkholderia pyrrocinia TaxID=60550 RepID=UPI0015891B81|nr:hypothetical protein [Burkholderia pyrrocinia]